MNPEREAGRIAYIREHTPPGMRPNFRLLAWHFNRRNASETEGILMRAWHRHQKKKRMEKP